MKKIALLVLVTLFSTVGFAQMQLATLNHNDSISAFYGGWALRDALNAAVNGDIITLSPGAFQAVNITKAVSIRGAGMSEDTIAGTNSTVLLGAFRLRIPNDLNHRLYMEGLSCAGDMEYDTVYNPYFVKCEFDEVSNYDASKSIMLTPNFVNCLIYSFSNYTGQNNNGCAQSPIFINSVITDSTATLSKSN